LDYVKNTLLWNPGNISVGVNDPNRKDAALNAFDKTIRDSLVNENHKILLNAILKIVTTLNLRNESTFNEFMEKYILLAKFGYCVPTWKLDKKNYKDTSNNNYYFIDGNIKNYIKTY
jgi:hypothetical protein